MNGGYRPSYVVAAAPSLEALEFLEASGWPASSCEPLSGDASRRRYFRVRNDNGTAVLMDASQNVESIIPFIRISRHLRELGFSAPAILARSDPDALLLVEDFGDATFAWLLEEESMGSRLYELATDVLIALHRDPAAIPSGLRVYDPETMLADIELFLEWRTPRVPESARAEFRVAWLEVLPEAHRVPRSLLLRDYHVANLMLLPQRRGIEQAGLLDFQDAYAGPVTYDLVSLLEDARRDVPEDIAQAMAARYASQFAGVDLDAFDCSRAIVAAQRHTRVLAIFERLAQLERRPEYKRLHSPRVECRLRTALRHPALTRVRQWMEAYAWRH